MDEVDAGALLQARIDLFERALSLLAPPPLSSFADHHATIARVVRADLSREEHLKHACFQH